MAIPTIYRGDIPGHIDISIGAGDWTNATLEVSYQNARRILADLEEGQTRRIEFSAEELSVFVLGAYPVRMTMVKPGLRKTIPSDDVRLKVTDCAGEVYSATIHVSPGGLVVDDATAGDSLGSVKEKVNKIIHYLKQGGVAALLFAACAASAVEPQRATPNEIPGDFPLVTNVEEYVEGTASNTLAAANQYTEEELIAKAAEVFTIIFFASEAGTNYTDSATNEVLTAAKAYTDSHVQTETDPVFSQFKSSYSINLGKYSDASGENATAIGANTTASGILSSAFGDGATASAGSATAIGTGATAQKGSSTAIGLSSWAKHEGSTVIGQNTVSHGIDTINLGREDRTTTSKVFIGRDSLATILERDGGRVKSVNGATGDVEVTTFSIGAASIEEMAETRQIVAAWESFLDGSNVVFSITNYISGAYNLDTAKMRIMELKETEPGVTNYVEVYNSREEVVRHLDAFDEQTVRPALETRAPKAWGSVTSAGNTNLIEDTVWMTAPHTVFAGGMEYQRVAVGEGAVCVLVSQGAAPYTAGQEGVFRFQDDGGTNYFGFAKTDSYTIGANTDAIETEGGVVSLGYMVTMQGYPCIWYTADLTSGEWEQLSDPSGQPIEGASHAVQWDETPTPAGALVCAINCEDEPSGFFRATIEMQGMAKFETNMPADLGGGILCTDGQHKVAIDWNNGTPRFVEVQ